MTETIPEDIRQEATRIADKYLGFEISCQRLYDDVARALMAQRTRQEERVRVLEEALRPFADQASTFDSCGKEFVPDRFEPAIVDHTIGDLRRARAALGNGGGDATA